MEVLTVSIEELRRQLDDMDSLAKQEYANNGMCMPMNKDQRVQYIIDKLKSNPGTDKLKTHSS